MSDRKNRDKGIKNTRKKLWVCGCWRCTDGKTKKRLLTQRVERKKPDEEINQ
jgi:hypothetical protein